LPKVVGVIRCIHPIYPINVGKIGCNFIMAISSPFLNGFGRCLYQIVGEEEKYLMREFRGCEVRGLSYYLKMDVTS